jgi:hypothetical protein
VEEFGAVYPDAPTIDGFAAIAIEELIDRALEMLYGSPGRQFSLTKLFGNKSQQEREKQAKRDRGFEM